jgi:hypothetical protein
MTSIRSSLGQHVPSTRGILDDERSRRIRRTALVREELAAISLRDVRDADLRERIRGEALRQLNDDLPPALPTSAPPTPQSEAKRRAEALFQSSTRPRE